MPTPSRWMVRTALAWLAGGLGLMLLAALPLPEPVHAWAVAARPAALHALTVGWLTQVIFGVGHWLLPRPLRWRDGGGARSTDRRAHLVHACLNAGLLLRLVAEPVTLLQPATTLASLLPVSAALQLAAALTFALDAWPRTRGPT